MADGDDYDDLNKDDDGEDNYINTYDIQNQSSSGAISDGYDSFGANDIQMRAVESTISSRDLLTVEKGFEDKNDETTTMFFSDKPDHRIDYALVYSSSDHSHHDEIRKTFEDHLQDVGVILEHELSTDGKLRCVKIHCPWDTLVKGARLIKLKKKIKVSKEMKQLINNTGCCHACSTNPNIIPDEEDYFTAVFDPARLHLFDIQDKNDFFTNAERSLIAKMFLDRCEYVETIRGNEVVHRGIDHLIKSNVYKAAYPLHEGRIKLKLNDYSIFEGRDKDRTRLHHGWAKLTNIFRYQPLDCIRKYFGDKVALYFAWLGVYTTFLIPASIFGLTVLLYGLISLNDDIPSNNICSDGPPGNYMICPMCDVLCDYEPLKNSCIYARLTYVFDNYATVALAVFMSVWALIYLEFCKREQAYLQYNWDTADYEDDEKYRPEYKENVTTFKINPITGKSEPYIPWFNKFARMFTSFSLILFLIAVVVVALFAVIVYRIAIAAAIFGVNATTGARKNATLITTVTSSIINLLLITILGMIYKRVALFATNLEKHKTFTDQEDSYTFKMIIFQFINYYGSLFYIAFFKGSFVDPPGSRSLYVFGQFRQDQCDPTGCFIELTIQLVIIMVGKQFVNAIVEILLPKIMICLRNIGQPKHKHQWEYDYHLQEPDEFLFFDDYLEMVIQFGFVTLFVTAFPLAPFFALLNNIIEIRLDAYRALKYFRRPPAMRAQDIGAWFDIMKAFAYIAVITNAFIIAWTSEFIPKIAYLWISSSTSLDGYINSTLSIFNTSNTEFIDNQKPDSKIFKESVNVTECRYRGYYEDFTITNQYKPEYWTVFFARMAFVIVFEHTCFLLMALVAILIPSMSGQVKRLKRYERQLLLKIAFEDTFEKVKERRQKTLTDAMRFNFD